MGARIAGIADAQSGLASPEGLHAADVEDLIRRREGRTLPSHPLRLTGPERELAYREDADLFIPAAISGSVDSRRLAQLARHGVRRIVCGANQPFREVRLGDTVTAQAADAEFEVVPDIVASQGAARAFHHLMTHPEGCTAEDIFGSVEESVDEAVDAVMERAGPARSGVMAAALDIALERTA
jgi:glutamate dehydrogenase/leucine dehydrogenase